MLPGVDVARRLDLLQKVDESVQELLHEGGPERAHLDADLKLGRLDLDDDKKIFIICYNYGLVRIQSVKFIK